VMVRLNASAPRADGSAGPSFSAEYEAVFHFPAGLSVADVDPFMGEEAYQYSLASQAAPCAMIHFKRELMATGVDSRGIEIGL
jgi:hypothetical protein